MPATCSSPGPNGSTELTTRAIVAALRGPQRVSAGGRRAALRVTHVSHVGARPIRDHQLLFAIGRHIGNAVVRNRCRRRVRAAFQDIRHQQVVPTGAYLFRPHAVVADMPYPDLVAEVGALLASIASSTTPHAAATPNISTQPHEGATL